MVGLLVTMSVLYCRSALSAPLFAWLGRPLLPIILCYFWFVFETQGWFPAGAFTSF